MSQTKEYPKTARNCEDTFIEGDFELMCGKKASVDDNCLDTMIEKQKVKDIKDRLMADCDYFIKNPQGMNLESALLTLKGNIKIEFENELGL